MTTAALTTYEIERNKPMPSLNHALIQGNLIFELKLRYKDRYSFPSELSLELSTWPSVPDLAIYPKIEMDLQHDVVTVTEPPLCAIEIISPSQSISELTAKASAYFKHGVQSCWIVIPPLGNIYVYSSLDTYEIFRSTDELRDPVLDIVFPLKDVFK